MKTYLSNFKLLIIAFLGFFLINCSTNEISSNSLEQNVEETLLHRGPDELHNLMLEYEFILNSKDYNEYLVSIDDFFSYLPIDYIEQFEAEEDLFTWIGININLTNFSNVAEAKDLFNKIQSKYEMVLLNNSDFFIRALELDDLSKIKLFSLAAKKNRLYFEPETFTESSSRGPCEFACINDATECNKDADDAYAVAIGGSGVAYFLISPGSALIVAVIASANHRAAVRGCARGFNACMRNCGW